MKALPRHIVEGGMMGKNRYGQAWGKNIMITTEPQL